MPATAINNDLMPSQMDELMPSEMDEVMPSQRPAGLPFITIPGKWKFNQDSGVHLPSQSSGGFSGPPSLQNMDDWSFTAATAPKIFNNAVTRTVGAGLNFAGQALKGDAESLLFQLTGQPDNSTQELIATAAKMMPSEAAKDAQLGIDTSDPYEDARATLPAAERIASGIGPGLIQSAPQLALTALQPEFGAASFGFTPDGFDPVQAAAAMIAPGGGKMIGGIAEKLAVKAGISNEQALGVINRLGGGAGVASLISAPAAYQIVQMKPGQERDAAIQDAASNAILTGILGSFAGRGEPSEKLDSKDITQNPVLRSTALEGLTPNGAEKPISQKLDDLGATVKSLEATIRGNELRSTPPDSPEPIPVEATANETGTETATASEPLSSEPKNLSFSGRAELLAQNLESLKTGINRGGQLHAFGIAADLWDRAVTVAQNVIRAGGSIGDAIDKAISHIRRNFTGIFNERGARAALADSLALTDNAQSESAQAVKVSAGRQARSDTTSPLREWGKYDLGKVPVGSDPIARWQSFPKSETPVAPQELPRTSDGLRLWAKNQLAKLPKVVRSPWGDEVVLHTGNDFADRASQYISGGAGMGLSRDRAPVLPMVANTIRNAMASATVKGRRWSAYLYRYAGGQLHVVIVDNNRGTVERQFVAKQDPHDRNFQRGSDLRVLYRNGIEGKAGRAFPASNNSHGVDKAEVRAENAAKITSPGQIPTIRGRRPINSRYAGQTHPSGIKFTSQGFPDFSPYAKLRVKLNGLTGRYAKDAALANKVVGLKKTPANYVWHHVEDGKTMQLIPKNIHKVRHTGGSAVIRNRGFDK